MSFTIRGLTSAGVLPSGAKSDLASDLSADGSVLHGAVAGVVAGGVPDPYSQPWDIVLVAGQSNSWETDYPAFFNTEPDDRVLAWDTSAGTAGVVPAKNDELGFAFARHYARTLLPAGRKVLKTRNGYGETGFSTTSLSGQSGYSTAPNGTWDRTLTTDPLNRALEVVSTAQSVLADAPAGSRIVAMLWSQGEQDRAKVTTEGQGWYQSRLDDLFGWVRTQLSLPELPIVVMSMTPETIKGTEGGRAVNRVHEATPSRLMHTAYAYGPEGMSKANEDIHFSYAAHDVRGRLAVEALQKARMNKSVIRPGAPSGLVLQVFGSEARARWVAPVQRVTSYELQFSTDLGVTWQSVVLSHAMALSASWQVPAGAPVWVRVRSANEYSTPSVWSPVVVWYGPDSAVTVDPAAPVVLSVSDYANRWVAARQYEGSRASLVPSTGSVSFTQSTSSAKEPTVLTDGVRLVRFDGVDDDMLASVGSATITVVARVKSAVGVNTAIFSTGPNFIRRTNENPPRIGTTISGQANQFHTYTEGTGFHVFTFVADGATGAMSVDGGYTTLNGATANTQILLGRYGTTNFGNIEVVEVIGWNRALSDTECGAVYSELKAGYPVGVIA